MMYGRRHTRKVLVAGWFSFENGAATAGDLLARDVACEWLERAGFAYDVALAAPFCGGVDWRLVDPDAYSHVVIVCGPFVRGERITSLASHFSGRRLVGLNLTMAEPLDAWNPFDLLLERDSPQNSRPDITFLASSERVPTWASRCSTASPRTEANERCTGPRTLLFAGLRRRGRRRRCPSTRVSTPTAPACAVPPRWRRSSPAWTSS